MYMISCYNFEESSVKLINCYCIVADHNNNVITTATTITNINNIYYRSIIVIIYNYYMRTHDFKHSLIH